MAKKRSVCVEEIENKARAEVRASLSLYTRDGKLVWVPQNVDRWDEYPNINRIFSTLNRFGKDDFVLHHGPLRKIAANLLERNVPPSPWRDYILFILRNLAPLLVAAAEAPIARRRNCLSRQRRNRGRPKGNEGPRSAI